jgi:DDE superfamily endonuclease
MSESGVILDNVHYLNEEYCRVVFNPEKFKERSGSNKPFVPTIEEMKMGLLSYFKENNLELLECKVESALEKRGHKILWTPPYSPDLQPIELFWAAGKNYARKFATNGMTMKETVKYVREGWYGNVREWEDNNLTINNDDYRRTLKEPVDCEALFDHTIVEEKKHLSQFVTDLPE